jgi:hypothetical protein
MTPPVFAPDYATARPSFRAAAQAVGAELDEFPHALTGLQGEALAVDVAWLGPRDARRVLVSISATHGIEGLYGSGCQVGFLQQYGHEALPPDMAILMIHALNPYGFSWLRRVNEDNIDINRNFIDFTQPSLNPGYETVHDWLPKDWTPETQSHLKTQIEAYMAEVGPAAAATAISGGQYTHPDGIFYGGAALCWSNKVLATLAQRYLQHAQIMAVLDHHTGLGPQGHTELICRHPMGSEALALAQQWWGRDVTSPDAGESVSAVLGGNVRMALVDLCPQALVVAIALEVGTQSEQQVIFSLLADNWLHQWGDPRCATGDRIRQQVRSAFYLDTDEWRALSYGRAMEIYQQGLQGLQTAHPLKRSAR